MEWWPRALYAIRSRAAAVARAVRLAVARVAAAAPAGASTAPAPGPVCESGACDDGGDLGAAGLLPAMAQNAEHAEVKATIASIESRLAGSGRAYAREAARGLEALARRGSDAPERVATNLAVWGGLLEVVTLSLIHI